MRVSARSVRSAVTVAATPVAGRSAAASDSRQSPPRTTSTRRSLAALPVHGVNAARGRALERSAAFATLPRGMQQDLLAGVLTPRTAAPEGESGVLSLAHALRAARRVAGLRPADRTRLAAVLARLAVPSGAEADPQTERALVLKALAARPRLDAAAFDELERFAREIHGTPRPLLVRLTSLLDLDGTRNEARGFIDGLNDKKPRGPLRRDRRADNDGLLQLYEPSCGPASVEVLLGECDPIYAWRVHRGGGPQALGTPGVSDEFQRAWLRHFGEAPRRRRGMHDYLRLGQLTKSLVGEGVLTEAARQALLRHCRSPQTVPRSRAAAALVLVRQRHEFPSARDVQRMQRALPAASTAGTDAGQLKEILDATLVPARGASVVRRAWHGERSLALRAAYRSASRGLGVIMGTADHWWAIADAQKDAAGRRYLVHDSRIGKSAWVPEAELRRGTFQRTIFGWPRKAKPDELIVARGALADARR